MSTIASEPNRLTHMPFLFRQQNQLKLVYCASDEMPRRVPQYSRAGTTRIWKMYWMPFRDGVGILAEAKRIHTGLGENEVECSPCVSRGGGRLYLSFIASARHGTGPLEHYLYRASGPDLDNLARPMRIGDEPCFAGFSRPDLTVTASGKDGLIRFDGASRFRLDTDFDEMSRISFCFDQPSRLLITGVSKSDRQRSGTIASHGTIVYDLDERRVLGQLELDGKPLYKPTICTGVMTYSGEHAQVREGWRLRSTDRFAMKSTAMQARVMSK